MANGHAILGPSSAEKWMNCPASVILEEGLPNASSSYADEGTAAHFLAEYCLTQDADPFFFVGRKIFVWDHPESDSSGCDWASEIGDGFELNIYEVEVDHEFAGFVNEYVQFVRQIAIDTRGNLLVEQRLPIDYLTDEEDAAGTADAVILTPTELIIVDLKFGRGERVVAEGNKQARIYALGALRAFDLFGEFETVRVIIHQPRAGGVSEWTIPVAELMEFAEEVKAAAERINLIRVLGLGEGDFSPSEKACRWCRAKATCPALAEHVQETIGADFEELDITTSEGALTPTGEAELLARKMNACGLIEDWISAVRGKVEYNLLHNTPVPGYKLVQGKQGNRKWIDPVSAEALLKKMKVKQDEMYDMSLISPTAAEKLFKAGSIGPKQWPKVEAEITRTAGKISVAPETDPRPAVEITPVADDFEDLGPELI